MVKQNNWENYYSFLKGSPVNEVQAYATNYNWIIYNEFLISRAYEIPLWVIDNCIEYIDPNVSYLRKLIDNYKTDGKIVIKRNELNVDYEHRISLLRKEENVAIIGNVVNSIEGWNTKVFSNSYSLGCDILIDINYAVKLSKDMIVAIDKNTLLTNLDNGLLTGINFDKVWVF